MNLLPFKLYGVFIAVASCTIGTYCYLRLKKIAGSMIQEKHHRERREIVTSEDLLKRFERIIQYKKSNEPGELKLAIIEGDILIEELLRLQGMQGDTVGALLSEATFQGMGGVDRFWNFHRLRNVLVHDSTYVLGVAQGQHALATLESALHSWNVSS